MKKHFTVLAFGLFLFSRHSIADTCSYQTSVDPQTGEVTTTFVCTPDPKDPKNPKCEYVNYVDPATGKVFTMWVCS